MKISHLVVGLGAALASTAALAQTTPPPDSSTAPQDLVGCYVRGDTLKVTLRSADGVQKEWSVGGSDLVAVQFVGLCAAAPSSPTPPSVIVGWDKTTQTLNSVSVFRK